MRNQSLPSIKYMERESVFARQFGKGGNFEQGRVVPYKLRQDALEIAARKLQAELVEGSEETERLQDMRETARPGSRLNFACPKRTAPWRSPADEELFGPGFAARTIGPDEEL